MSNAVPSINTPQIFKYQVVYVNFFLGTVNLMKGFCQKKKKNLNEGITCIIKWILLISASVALVKDIKRINFALKLSSF
jgi:hypothetical protein